MAFQYDAVKSQRVDLQQSNIGQVGAGEGDDVYVIDAQNFPIGNKTITINDGLADGNNKLVLVGGLEIVSSKVYANALELTLNNGVVVQVLGASTFVFQTGGAVFTGVGGLTQTYDEFVTQSLGTTVPVDSTPTTGGAVTVNPAGGTTGGGPIVPPVAYTLTAAATSVNEGATAIFNLTTLTSEAGKTVNYTIGGTVNAADITGGLLTGSVVVGADGKAVIAIPISADATTEQAETLTVTLNGLAATASTVINDTSVGPDASYFLKKEQDIATANKFFASQTVFNIDGVGPTLNAGDFLTGTAGRTDNTLTVTDLTAGAAFNNIPAGVTLVNIQNVVLNTSGNTAGGTGFSTVGYDGVKTLNGTSNSGGNDIYGAKNGTDGTAVTVAHNGFTGNTTVVGGTDVTVSTIGGNAVIGNSGTGTVPLSTQVATGAIVVNQQNTGAGAVNVFGGTTVDVTTSSTSNTGTIDIGNTAGNTGNSSAGAIANASGDVTVKTSGTGAATVFGGDNVSVTSTALRGAGAITVGDVGFVDASNMPAGNVTITETNQIAYNGLAGSINNNTANGAIGVYGGKDVTITTNGANAVNVGQVLNAAKEDALNPAGTITVTNTGVVDAAAAATQGAINITGGTDVTVTTTGANVNIGRSVNAVTDQVSNPTGDVTVTQTMNGAGFGRAVTVDGGADVTVNAKGQTVTIGGQAASAPTGAVVVNQADVFTGNTNAVLNGTNAGNVTVRGGTDVTVNTTGGNVVVGGVVAGVNTVPSGAVKITNTFGGVGADAVTVQGGTTVDITTTKTSGSINVGLAASDVLNAAGTALKDASLAPTGDVTIVSKTVSGANTAYGSNNVNVYANGAETVSINGAEVDDIIDIQSKLATGGPGSGTAVGTSKLKTVVLDNSTGGGTVSIRSDALTNLTVTNQKGAADTITVTNNTAAHALTITQGGNSTVGATIQVVDAKAGSLTISDNGTASTNTLRVDATKATAVTVDNSAAASVRLDGVSTDIATVTLKGAGAATLVGTLGAGNLSKALMVDASAATGNVTAGLALTTEAGKVQEYKGGSAIDTVTIGSNASGWGDMVKVDGGNGGADVLVANYAALGTDVALGNAASVKGFEVLQLGAAANSAGGNYDASGFSTVRVGAVAGSVAVTGAATGLTLDVLKNTATANGDNFTVSVTGANYAATNTAMTVNLGSGVNNIIAQGAGVQGTGVITANGVEALTVNAVGGLATALNPTGLLNTATINGAASNGAATLAIGGTKNLDLTSNTGFKSINATANTGASVDVSKVLVSNAATTFTGGAAKLTATGSNDTGTVKALVTLAGSVAPNYAAGQAATVTISGGAGTSDAVYTFTTTAAATAAQMAAALASAINTNAATGAVTGGALVRTGTLNTTGFATQSGGNIVLQSATPFEVQATNGAGVAATTSIADSLLGGQQQNVLTVTANVVSTVTINGTAISTVAAGADAPAQAVLLAAAITAASPAGISSAVAVGSTVVVISQLGQTNLVVGTTNITSDVTTINNATVNNSFITGAGGGDYTAGLGGSWNKVVHKYSSGSETVNLTASTAKVDTLKLNNGAVVTDNGSAGGVTKFVVGSQAASDVMTFVAGNKTIVANAVTGVVNTLNGAATMANVLDSSGALNTALANLTFTISNGVITFSATGGNSLSQFTVNQLINAAQIIVSSTTTGGANQVAAFSHNGKSYVVASDATGGGGVPLLRAGADSNSTIVELKDVASVKGFGSTFGENTIVSSTVTNLTNATVDLATLAANSNLDYTGFAKATLNVGPNATAVTKFSNLAASAELVISGTAGSTGFLETTQVGTSGQNSLTVTMSTAAKTIERLTTNGDALVKFATVGAFAQAVKELVDATNTMNTVQVTGSDFTLDKITGTALTNVNTVDATGAVTLGSVANAIAQSNVKFDLAVGQAATIVASGAGDIFTQGTAINVGTGAVNLTASGAGTTISLSNGVNTIVANGAGNMISVGTGTNTITATGSDTTTVIAANAAVTTVTVGTNAKVTVATNDVVKVNGAVSGGDSANFAKTTVTFAATTVSTGTIIDFDDNAAGVTYSLLGTSAANSQVNVATATSLAAALDMAANHTLLTQDQGVIATATVVAGGGALAANTGEITWFQYGGDTYLVAMVNDTSVAVQQTKLDANDIVVKLVGLHDLTGSNFEFIAGSEALTLS